MIGVRDPFGFRPLVLGRLPVPAAHRGAAAACGRRRGRLVPASETAGLDIVGAEYVRDVEPGEIVVLEPGRPPRSVRFAEATPALCVFELIYFARPDSYMEGRNLYEARRRMGEQLAVEHPAETDLVMPVPDTGAPAAAGFAEASGIPYREGLVRNRYTGRTFIQPSQTMRQRGVTMKLNPLREVVRGSGSMVVDDSIVRGTTTKQIVALLRQGRRARGPPPDQRPADLPPVLLRHRHPDRDRADRGNPFRGRDPRVRRRGLARLPVDPRRARGARPAVRAVLLRLLRRPLPGARAVRRGERKFMLEERWPAGGRDAGGAYARRGVDVAAGERAVELMRAAVASTRRRPVGASAGSAGSGGRSRSPPGYREPVLVGATDGVGTKTAIAVALGAVRHDRGRPRRDVRRRRRLLGREPLFFLDYVAVGRLDPLGSRSWSAVVGGLPRGGLCPRRWRDGRASGLMADDEFDLAGFVRRRRRAGRGSSTELGPAGTRSSAWRRAGCTRTASRSSVRCSPSGTCRSSGRTRSSYGARSATRTAAASPPSPSTRWRRSARCC